MPNSFGRRCWEISLLMLLFFVHAGDPPPAVNEAHYLCKAKNYWAPDWCENDLFIRSGKAHVVFYATFGWLTQFTSLAATAWVGRIAGWLMIAWSLQRLSWCVAPRPYLSLLVGLLWIVGIEQCDLAGEWVIGGIEAKIFAYGFVLLAMQQIAVGRWQWVWPMLGAASAFHVLVGGWSVVAAMIALAGLGEMRSWRRHVFPLMIGGALALFGVVPGLSTMRGVEPEIARQAASIYTYERLPHHLYPAGISVRRYVGHAILIVLLLVLGGWARENERVRRLLWFTMGCVVIGLCGLAIGMLPAVAPDLAARVLRYYWFRMSDAIIPLAVGLCCAALMAKTRPRRSQIAVVSIMGGIAAIWFAAMFWDRRQAFVPEASRLSLVNVSRDDLPEQRQQVFDDWVRACAWIQDNTDTSDVFLTPRHQQTFKWYAERAEVVNWKDVPQDATSLLEWQSRMEEVFPKRLGGARVSIRYSSLRDFRKRFGAKYLVVDRRINPGNLPLVLVYPHAGTENRTFRVYELPY